jgi:hypothetical protein
MKDLTIHKRIVPHAEGSKAGDFLESAALVVVGILCSPIILIVCLIVWLATQLSDYQAEKNFIKKEPIDNWFLVDTPGDIDFSLSYTAIDSGSVSEAAAEFFDNEQLYLYRAVPPVKFFEGYFTKFRLEQPAGIFVQKIYFNDTLEEVVSMPLYFFDYQTAAFEEIHDLKDYILDVIKGNEKNLLLTASGEEHDLEIRIIRS